MNRLFSALLLLACITTCVLAASAPTSLIIHPGETIYARFEVSGKKIRLASLSPTADASAQVVFSLQKDEAKGLLKLKVENKLSSDLVYRAEMRSLTLKQHFPALVTPVVAGKAAYETFPIQVEELSAFDFKLVK